jgi:hypothetical protein
MMGNTSNLWLGKALLGMHQLFKQQDKKKIGTAKVDLLIWLILTFREDMILPGSNESLSKMSRISLVTVSDSIKILRELKLIEKINNSYYLLHPDTGKVLK